MSAARNLRHPATLERTHPPRWKSRLGSERYRRRSLGKANRRVLRIQARALAHHDGSQRRPPSRHALDPRRRLDRRPAGNVLPAVEYTASQGAVRFTLQYRLGSVGPAVEDAESALVWIRRHAKEPLGPGLGTVPKSEPTPSSPLTPSPPSPVNRPTVRVLLPRPAASRRSSISTLRPRPSSSSSTARKTRWCPYQQPERFRAAHPKTNLSLYPDSRHAFVVPGYTATLQEVDRALSDALNWLRESGLLPLQR